MGKNTTIAEDWARLAMSRLELVEKYKSRNRKLRQRIRESLDILPDYPNAAIVPLKKALKEGE